MSLIFLLVFAGPVLVFLGHVVGMAITFPLVLLFHGLRGLVRHFVVPCMRRLFQKKVIYDPS